LAALSLSLMIALSAYALFTRNNDFPLNYQPDERSKSQQIMQPEQPRNLNHPPLLLEAGNLMRQWRYVPADDERAVTIAGREASAALAAIGVFALAIAGYNSHGFHGLLLCGAAGALCPQWLVHAHFFKEDAALAAGVAVTICGAAMALNSTRLLPQLIGCTVLGIGCAAAASAKYVGVMIVPAGLVAVILAPFTTTYSWRRLLAGSLLFVAAIVGGLLLFNARAMASFFPPRLAPTAIERIQFGFNHAVSGHYGVALMLPNTFCVTTSLRHLLPHLWVLSVCATLVLLFRRRRPNRWFIVLSCIVLVQAVVLSFNAIPFARYALPLTVTLFFLVAQLMASSLNGWSSRRWLACLMTAGCVALIVAMQLRVCLAFDKQFRNDSRQQLREWVAQNIPTDAMVVSDGYANMWGRGDPERFPDQAPLHRPTLVREYAADPGFSPQQLADRGVDYVVVADQSYDRFFVRGVVSMPEDPTYVERYQQFYRELFASGNLVWSAVPAPHSEAFVYPEIRVYQISQLRTAKGVTEPLLR
jgi:hypothetical protein